MGDRLPAYEQSFWYLRLEQEIAQKLFPNLWPSSAFIIHIYVKEIGGIDGVTAVMSVVNLLLAMQRHKM
jgi:hypothetical protein